MHEYRLNDPRQGIIGPVRLQTVRDLVEAGVIAKDVLVSRDGGPWQPIHAYAELFGPLPETGARQPTYSGDLGKNSFFKVFYRFHLARATGLLIFRRANEQKDVYLEAGKPVFVASTVESERIGQFLVQRGKLTEAQLAQALEAMHHDHYHLGYTLIRLRMIAPQEFYYHLQEQQIMRLGALCRWQDGRYQFFDGQRYNGAKTELNLVVPELVMRAAREMDETTLARRLERHFESVPRRLPQRDIDQGTFQLSTLEQRALYAIDGRRRLIDLLREVAHDHARRNAVLRVVLLLSELDALVFEPTQR